MAREEMDYENEDGSSREVKPDAGAIALLARAEIDGQIATAKAYPRKMGAFVREALELATVSEDVAESCIYSLPRGKGESRTTITGPSVRFAEILSYGFGNSRAGARVVDSEGGFVTAQGVFHDLEKNTMVTMEVKRRITDKHGRRYNEDMVGVTGNAAASIAFRNAVLRAIPKALWLPVYEKARMVAVGDLTTLDQRRKLCLAWFQHKGVTEEMVLAKMELVGIEDIGLDELEYLTGIKTAMRDGSTSVESAFGPERAENPQATRADPGKVAGELRARAARGKEAPTAAADAGAAADEAGLPQAGTAEPDPAPEYQHPMADRMRAAKKKAELEAVYDDVLATVPKGEDRTALAQVYEDELARIERDFGKL